jgi:hypothetical protein
MVAPMRPQLGLFFGTEIGTGIFISGTEIGTEILISGTELGAEIFMSGTESGPKLFRSNHVSPNTIHWHKIDR